MAETSLEKQKRIAAEQNNFQAWRDIYRAEQQMADQWGGGLINGQPAATVVDATQVQVEQAPPQMAAGNPALVAQNAARLRQEGLDNNSVREQGNAQRYARFLGRQGIDAQTIGGGQVDDSGRFQAPSLREQEEATSIKNRYSGERNRLNIAANRIRNSNPVASAQLRQQVDEAYPLIGGRSVENQTNYWLNRLNPTDYMRRLGLPGNGFQSGVDYNTAWGNSQVGYTG